MSETISERMRQMDQVLDEGENRSRIRAIDIRGGSNLDFDALVGNRPQILEQMGQLIYNRTQSSDPNINAVGRYEIEYANASELAAFFQESGIDIGEDETKAALGEGTNYVYWSPLMDRRLYDAVVPLPSEWLTRDSKILDVGAGSGDFIKTLLTWGVSPEQIYSVDISPTSQRRIAEMGCNAECGRLESVADSLGADFDYIFLSYFIDRDTDQLDTLKAALPLLKKRGFLILEGLFPCELFDPSGLSYSDNQSKKTVTRGKYAVEDIVLVYSSIEELGKELEIRTKLVSYGSGERYVYSRDGRETLNSDVLVFYRPPDYQFRPH